MKRSRDCILESTSNKTIEEVKKTKRHDDDEMRKHHAQQFEMKICQGCKGVCAIRKVKQNNTKGNAGKCYYTCTNKKCNYFAACIISFET